LGDQGAKIKGTTAKRNEDVAEKKEHDFKKKSTKHFCLNDFLCPKTTR